jgi:3-methyladenine DNA glycosylase AlkD
MSITDEIVKTLYLEQDHEYKELQTKIIPTVDADAVIGVRTPQLRVYAKELSRREDIGQFLDELPHKYFDENQLHAFIIAGIKNYDDAMARLEAFLPYVNNWATCDQMSPKVFKKNKTDLLKHIRTWIKSKDTYTVRFGVGMLMEHFLDEDFDVKYPVMVSNIRSDEYYVNMMTAWYFATALAKQYDAVLPYIENRRLDDWTHNKAIQKAIESYRITPEQKAYLKTLKTTRKSK